MQLRLVTILLSNGVKYFKSVANQQDCRNILCIVLLLDANFIIDNVIDSGKFNLIYSKASYHRLVYQGPVYSVDMTAVG